MVQFNILSGKKAGASWAARRFPVRIGRASGNSLQLDDPGVWDSHLRVDLERRTGFKLTTLGEALASVNGEPASERLLRNGDTLQVGSVQLQFWLAETRQSSLALREWLIWLGVVGVCLAQIVLIYTLLR